MSRCLAKPLEGTSKPRSHGGQGHRSHQQLQSLVEPVIHPVQIADERMGFVQGAGGVSCVLLAGAGVCCSKGRLATSTRLSTCAVSPAGAPAREAPFAPPVRHGSVGASPNFSPLFLQLCKLTNRKDFYGIRNETKQWFAF
jgi:hypothetical protein